MQILIDRIDIAAEIDGITDIVSRSDVFSGCDAVPASGYVNFREGSEVQCFSVKQHSVDPPPEQGN